MDGVFERLDYLYVPSRDVAPDLRFFVDVVGGRAIFAVEAMGTRVAMVALTDEPPQIVLAGHLEGDRPILVYRVGDLDRATRDLEQRGWQPDHALEIPQGPVRSFTTQGGQRLAVYQLTRPGVIETFTGRRDF